MKSVKEVNFQNNTYVTSVRNYQLTIIYIMLGKKEFESEKMSLG